MSVIDLTSVKNGIVCFTFDDRSFAGWLEALPLFQKYNAHGTFLVSGEMDDAAIAAMTTLHNAGHTVGLHSLHHADAPEYFELHGAAAYYDNELAPQLSPCEKAGLSIRAFGYPNNRRDPRTDLALGQYFRRFRAGVTGASEEEIYVPMTKLPENRVMHGFGIGTYYHTVREELTAKLHRAAQTNTCVTFFSHNIAPAAEHIHMPTELLEHCLQECARCGLLAVGFDQLP